MVVSEYDTESTNEVNHRMIALSCVAHGTGDIDKLTIARSFNLAVHEYNAEIDKTIKHCQDTGTTFEALRSC